MSVSQEVVVYGPVPAYEADVLPEGNEIVRFAGWIGKESSDQDYMFCTYARVPGEPNIAPYTVRDALALPPSESSVDNEVTTFVIPTKRGVRTGVTIRGKDINRVQYMRGELARLGKAAGSCEAVSVTSIATQITAESDTLTAQSLFKKVLGGIGDAALAGAINAFVALNRPKR